LTTPSGSISRTKPKGGMVAR